MELAKHVSHYSKDPSTQTGAVIAYDKKIVSIGYNGFPAGVEDHLDRLENRDTKLKLIIHCEMNAILNASESVEGLTLYTYPFASCTRCAVHVIQAGICRVVAPKVVPERWQDEVELSMNLFREAGVEIKLYDLHS